MIVKRHPFLVYFLIAFALFWGCIALGFAESFRFWAPILGALAPAVSALLVTGLSEGEPAIRALVRRLGEWRVPPWWYGVVFGLPVVEGILSLGVAELLGKTNAPSTGRLEQLRAVGPALWVAYVFAASEEIGWRGFALPRLLASRAALVASVILGALHAFWHWPLLLLPGQLLSDVPLVPYSMSVIAEAVVFTWIFQNTGGSLLLPTLFHGSSNIAMVLYDRIDPGWMPWLKCSISVLVALVLVLLTGRGLKASLLRDGARDRRASTPSSLPPSARIEEADKGRGAP